MFEGGSAPPSVGAEVVERRGCDLEPIDPNVEDGRLALLSYVWPDQLGRIERLRAALRVAEGIPAAVERADAVEWLEQELGRPSRGTATVVFHSIVIDYLDEAPRRRFVELMEEAGGRATGEAPLAWLSLERAGDRFEVRLREWPGREDRLLAFSKAHGPPVEWLG